MPASKRVALLFGVLASVLSTSCAPDLPDHTLLVEEDCSGSIRSAGVWFSDTNFEWNCRDEADGEEVCTSYTGVAGTVTDGGDWLKAASIYANNPDAIAYDLTFLAPVEDVGDCPTDLPESDGHYVRRLYRFGREKVLRTEYSIGFCEDAPSCTLTAKVRE